MKKKRSPKTKGMLLVLFGIAAIVVFMFITTVATRPMHCVSGIALADSASSESLPEYKCFDNQAEAINYATGGKVNLPHNASQAEIHDALLKQSS